MTIITWIVLAPFALLAGVGILLVTECAYVVAIGHHVDETILPMEIAGTTLTFERRQNSPIGLAEYRRLIHLRRSGWRIVRYDLVPDHGGVVAVNAYLREPATVLLIDRISGIAIDMVSAAPLPFHWDCGMTRPEDATYLGTFDRVGPGADRHRLRFFPAAERVETPIPYAPEVC